jgi:hypothetical protein
MINWIEINLPWYKSVDYPAVPNLSQREKETFGKSGDEYRKEITIDEKLNLLSILDIDSDIVAIKEYDSFRVKVDVWYESQPEMIQWRKDLALAIEKAKEESFSQKELNNPGTLIQMENGDIHLIGSINALSGVCDDCCEFEKDAIVKRYAILIDLENH